MPDLLAVGYERESLADDALAALHALADEHALKLCDAAVLVKRADGRVVLRQTRGLAAGEGLVGGGTIGLLLGLVIGVPVGGALVGLAGGGGFSALDRGISDDRMRRFGKELEPGGAALFALLAGPDWPLVRERLEPYGGELAASEVSDDVVAALGGRP